MGGYEVGPLGSMEPPLGYHSLNFENLTPGSNPAGGQCLMDSLTGAVAS